MMLNPGNSINHCQVKQSVSQSPPLSTLTAYLVRIRKRLAAQRLGRARRTLLDEDRARMDGHARGHIEAELRDRGECSN